MTTSRDAGEDLLHILDELDDLITHARSMPMSASAIVNREAAQNLIDRARDAVPTAVHRAEKIVADREANGPFKTVEDLKRVSGIGDKKFAALADAICVG